MKFGSLMIAPIWFLFSTATAMAEEPAGAPQFNSSFKPILEIYLTIQESLAADTVDHLAPNAQRALAALNRLDTSAIKGPNEKIYKNLPKQLIRAFTKIGQATQLDQARKIFYKVSRPITMWASTAQPKNTQLMFCSMANGGWLQKKGPIRNPYFGKKMLECGEVIPFASK